MHIVGCDIYIRMIKQMLKNASVGIKVTVEFYMFFKLISLSWKSLSEVIHKSVFSDYIKAGIFGCCGHHTRNIMTAKS